MTDQTPAVSPEEVTQAKSQLRAQVGDVRGAFDALTESLEKEIEEIRQSAASGGGAIPEAPFSEIEKGGGEAAREAVKKRGCVVVRGVFSQQQAQGWDKELEQYVKENNYVEQSREKRGMDKYFSSLSDADPQIFAVYWSRPQVMARQSEQLAVVRKWLNSLWQHQDEGGAEIFNPERECAYADRIRRRQPGDKMLGLSPHIDGGSVERWLDDGYRRVYGRVFSGDWENHDPFNAAHRTETREIPSPAVCRMFRTYQGWTALTAQGKGDGTLQLVPSVRAMSWMLLRALQDDVAEEDLCGATPGKALAATEEHHALLLRGLISIPKMMPGDTVWWHPDVVHAVENENGEGWSNVIYIGAAPSCGKNDSFLQEQLPCFLEGRSSPDFAPENYEVDYPNRARAEDLTPLGRRQMGLDAWEN